jgi:hypothetical protein
VQGRLPLYQAMSMITAASRAASGHNSGQHSLVENVIRQATLLLHDSAATDGA